MVAPLLLVDAPHFLFRAFFALPASIKGTAGRPVNALLGSVNAILGAAGAHGARAVVCCFGPDAAPYRVELFDGYHAHREAPPDELAWQWDHAPGLYGALGWSVDADPSVEADDLLGSYAAAEADAGGRALIFTGDRDMFQCVGEAVTVLFPRGGKDGPEEIGPDEVRRRYGVDPAQVPDFIALRGDPSDGIPGAKGVGPKTAADILRRHGSLEAALEAAAEGTSLATQRERLLAFKEIATLRRLEVEPPPNRETDRAGGAAEARELGMNRLARRLEEGRPEPR